MIRWVLNISSWENIANMAIAAIALRVRGIN